MENIKRLHKYLDSKEVTDLISDIAFYPTVQETKDFLNRVGKDEVIKVLSIEQKDKLFSIIDEIHRYAENYVATKNNALCLSINHFLSQGYDILFIQIKDFEKKFSEILADNSTKISKLTADLQNRATDFDSAFKTLDSSKEKAGKTVQNIEEQLKKALEIVNEYINNVKKENDKQIGAKRLQIDTDITNYKREVEGKFNDVLTGFQKFKEDQIQEFEKVDKRRKEFVDMYEIGVKYSKEARFDEYSMKEKKTADMFRWLSLGLMVLVVLFIALLTLTNNLQPSQQGETKAESYLIISMLSRFLLVFSLMIPAVYASRESSRHRRNSDKYAQMANELKAFEIAIRTEDMKPEIKDRIKEEIFKRYFGNIFANTTIDKTFSEDIGVIAKAFKPKQKEKTDDEK
jgi:hypothetical protein